MSTDSGAFDDLLHEERRFPPASEITAEAVVSDASIYEEASRDREAYWAQWAQAVDWVERWSRARAGTPPHAQWFVD